MQVSTEVQGVAMPSCFVPGCKSRTPASKEQGITFHTFPKDPGRRKEWAEIVRPHQPGWEPTKYTSVCSKHFLEEHFDRTSQLVVRLRSEAVPVLWVPCLRHLSGGTAAPALYLAGSLPTPHPPLQPHSGLISADGGGDEVPVDACVVEVASSSQGLPCVEDPLQPSSPTATATARLPPSGGVVAACDVAASSGLDLLGVEDPVEPSSPSSTTVSATSPSSRGDTAACGVVDSFDLDLPGEEDPIGPSSAPSATVSTTSSPSRSGMATCGVVPSSGLDFPGVEDPVRPSTSSSTASATSVPSSGGMAAYDADLHGEEGSCAPSYTIIFDTAATDVGDAEAAVEMLSTVEEESSSAEPLEKPKRILRVHNVPIVFELVDDGRAKNDSSSGCGSPPLVESRTPRNSCAFELSFGQKQSGPKSTHLASEDTLSGRGVHHDEIDALIRVLASVGRIADQVAPSSMDAVMASLEEDIRRPGCPMKVRQILSDVLELRATQWQLGSS